MKAFLQQHVRAIHTIKIVVACLLGIMVIIDVVLVMLEERGFPTFSWVVRDNRTALIWLTFLYGGLVSKIFFNRIAYTKKSEGTGFISFLLITGMLAVLGRVIDITLTNEYHLMLLLCGGVLAYRVWPQYKLEDQQSKLTL